MNDIFSSAACKEGLEEVGFNQRYSSIQSVQDRVLLKQSTAVRNAATNAKFI